MRTRRFGIAWIAFALALALHVADEATHDFLASYNPSVLAIRARFPLFPLPTFTFDVWLSLLIAGVTLLLCLSPLAFRGIAAWPLGLLVALQTPRCTSAVPFIFTAGCPGCIAHQCC